jgi:exopolyphosphatase/pppGpp-phosphohydrolase
MRLVRAVRSGSLAGLKRLEMQSWGVQGGATAVIEALAEGHCPLLQSFQIKTWPRARKEDMLLVLTAMAEGRLREIRSLTFGYDQIGSAGVAALVEAMADGHELQELEISDRFLSEQDLLSLVGLRKQLEVSAIALSTSLSARVLPCQVQAIRAGGGRLLRKLCLTDMKTAMTDNACAALADALIAGACPRLVRE